MSLFMEREEFEYGEVMLSSSFEVVEADDETEEEEEEEADDVGEVEFNADLSVSS